MAHDCNHVQAKLDPANIAQTEDDEFQELIDECFNCEVCTKWAIGAYPGDPDDELEKILRFYHRLPRHSN